MASGDSIGKFRYLRSNFEDIDIRDYRFLKLHLGEKSLKNHFEIFEEFRRKYDSINEIIENIGDATLRELTVIYQDFFNTIESIDKLTDAAFMNRRETLINELIQSKEDLLDVWPQIAILIIDKKDTEKAKEINSIVEKALRSLEESKSKASNIVNEETNRLQEQIIQVENIRSQLEFELNNFEQRYNPLLTSGEFMAQQDIFKGEVNDHKKMANRWLIATVISGVILLFIILYILNHFQFDSSGFSITNLSKYKEICTDCGNQMMWFEIIKSIMFRLFLLGTGIFLLLFTIRNYNSHMHNKTINAHKQNSLAAAMSLLNRATTDAGKDELIVQAALSIFTHQKTGYLNKEERINSSVVEKILEKK